MTDRTYRITDPFERTIDRHAGELNERGPQDGHDAEAFGVVRLLLHLHPADPQVVEAMAEVLRDGGCEVTLAAIEFTDPRYADRFKEFPMPHPFREVVGMLPMEIRRGKGEIGIPDEVNAGGYDLVCVGSPTWWFSPSVPIRSFLESDAGHRLLDGRRFAAFAVCRRYWKHNLKTVRRIAAVQGGTFVEGIHFSGTRADRCAHSCRC